MSSEDQVHHVSLHVTPGTGEPMTVSLEPTGMEYRLAEGEHLRVGIDGPAPGVVEIAHLPDRLVIWSWAGAEMRAWDSEGRPLPV